MKIYLGTDHAGFYKKELVKKYLTNIGFDVLDFGAFVYEASDDYPDFIKKVASKLSDDFEKGLNNKGIIFGGSGQGEAIVANRFKNIRACVYYGGPLDIVKLSREHNDSNVLSFGARFLNDDEIIESVDLWLGTKFSGDIRHVRRIKKIDNL